MKGGSGVVGVVVGGGSGVVVGVVKMVRVVGRTGQTSSGRSCFKVLSENSRTN